MKTNMTRAGITALLLTLAGATGAFAQSCEKTFAAGGEPFLTGINYRASGIVKAAPAKALNGLKRGMAAEGFSNVSVDQEEGTVTGFKDGAGSGRLQRLQGTARKAGNGSIVEIFYQLQSGQVSDEAYIRTAFCRIINGAGR